MKQTQLTSSYNKKSNKIYVKPQNKNHLFKLDSYEKANGHSLLKANTKKVTTHYITIK